MNSIIDLEYLYPADDVAASVTPTLVGATAATGYEVAFVGDQNPAHPFKTNETTFRLVWDFGSAITLRLIVIIHQNFAAGLAGVVFQMHTSNSWTSPLFSKALTCPAYHEDLFPVNMVGDLRETNPKYRYASLAVTSANTVPCAMGEVVLARTVRALTGTLQMDAEEDESHPLIENRTDVGVSTIYAHGTRWRWLRGDIIQSQTTAEALRAWNRATQGRGKSCLIWPHIDDADEPWFVRWEQNTLPRAHIAPDELSRYRLSFEETSRGLRPTPAAVG